MQRKKLLPLLMSVVTFHFEVGAALLFMMDIKAGVEYFIVKPPVPVIKIVRDYLTCLVLVSYINQ